MSRGQIPRRPEYFPRMKHRARKRWRGKARVIWWDEGFRPLWPQPQFTSITINNRSLNFDTGFWEEAA